MSHNTHLKKLNICFVDVCQGFNIKKVKSVAFVFQHISAVFTKNYSEKCSSTTRIKKIIIKRSLIIMTLTKSTLEEAWLKR